MTLTKSTFKVLNALRDEAVHTQRHIATATGLSLGTVNTAYRALVDAGLAENFSVTPAGFEALSPYKVDNAIIMAAGLSSRFAPLSYEKPKGVLTVRGEVLIERQIRQLREAGITDITVVVGYMKEAFFYLEDKFGVTIRVNAEYSVRNNNSTLMLVREKLGNTYVCSSDDYFTENVFEPYVFEAYYPGVFFAGETNEYLLDTARDGRITGVTIGGRDKYGMLGHVYFDRAFSETFVRILVDEYDRPETAGKLWEDIYRAHLDELRMVMRPYEPGVIYEFDSISDLKEFDHDFIENVDSAILDNICRVLDCSRGDVCHRVRRGGAAGVRRVGVYGECAAVDFHCRGGVVRPRGCGVVLVLLQGYRNDRRGALHGAQHHVLRLGCRVRTCAFGERADCRADSMLPGHHGGHSACGMRLGRAFRSQEDPSARGRIIRDGRACVAWRSGLSGARLGAFGTRSSRLFGPDSLVRHQPANQQTGPTGPTSPICFLYTGYCAR